MIEKHQIEGRDIWVEIQQQPANRPNPNTIPTEYFTARYYTEDPANGGGHWITDEEGQPRLFESPVAALSQVNKKIIER